MRSRSCLGLLAAAALVSAVPSARAQVYVRFGQAVPVVPATPGLPDSPLPVPQVVPVLPAPSLLPVRPLTVNEFVSAFKPLPGQYEVLLVHPKTGCPVKVCFTLKPGCIRTVRVKCTRSTSSTPSSAMS